ncbi:MAG: endonuclease/exonuclease/phosphatase family protein [Methylococcaceae bacterium]|jgi:endonuclease/exonuclease/phosphatase family metal-dependent hydrolase|nr:endonuclease/exonuclease/phosphatase family protein [Methylococcaceae bacterium]
MLRSSPQPQPTPGVAALVQPQRLRLASFNIQTGISTTSYRDMITGSWRHVWPSHKRLTNLGRIAQLLRPFDIVGLQEVDGGGLRSRGIIQTQYLAEHAGFPHWHNQINRRMGGIALHSNGLLSRFKPLEIRDYKLPGLPGRGVVVARYGRQPGQSLYVCVVHLALSRRARLRQLGFVGELLKGFPHAVVMGDFNCEPGSPELQLLTSTTELSDPGREINTWPSWQPSRMIDHILVTPGLKVEHVEVLHFTCSDHLPIAMDVVLPEDLKLHP